jgi:hypothetical protein
MAWRCTSWRRLQGRLAAGLALFAYLSTTIGFPLPVVPVKDHSQRYPCEHHLCGCRNAEDCWRHCCCHTPEERWAWARANGIEPPAYAERPVSDGWRTARLRDRAEAASCPNCRRESAGQQNASSTSPRPCCAGHANGRSCCQAQPPKPTTEAERKPGAAVGWVAGMAAQQCRGVSTLWLSSGAVLPPPPRVAWNPCLVPLGWVSCPEASPRTIAHLPAVPPPRSL